MASTIASLKELTSEIAIEQNPDKSLKFLFKDYITLVAYKIHSELVFVEELSLNNLNKVLEYAIGSVADTYHFIYLHDDGVWMYNSDIKKYMTDYEIIIFEGPLTTKMFKELKSKIQLNNELEYLSKMPIILSKKVRINGIKYHDYFKRELSYKNLIDKEKLINIFSVATFPKLFPSLLENSCQNT